MEADVRASSAWREAESLFESFRKPGTGMVTDASELHVAPSGEFAVFSGTSTETLEATPFTKICCVDLNSGLLRVLTPCPYNSRCPKISPDSKSVAFTSDPENTRAFQAFILDLSSGAVAPVQEVPGSVEYVVWSPDGAKLLLGIAGRNADLSSVQGATSVTKDAGDNPSWMPAVSPLAGADTWRKGWVYDLRNGRLADLTPAGKNVWDMAWCGPDKIASLVSDSPGEDAWYTASLEIIELESRVSREVYAAQRQLGCLQGSKDGKRLAVIEGVCSDRGILAGDLKVINLVNGKCQTLCTGKTDVSYAEWISASELLIAGHRGLKSVVSVCNFVRKTTEEVWNSLDITTGGSHFSVSGIGTDGDCALIGESFGRPPEIAQIRKGRYHTVTRLNADSDGCGFAVTSQIVTWCSADDLMIEGWLLSPPTKAPSPTVMVVHGGPIWHWRPNWLGRKHVHLLMLLKHGFAIFLPNPRGSTGRGQRFASAILGDMGGADTHDFLTGLDKLVAEGLADPNRLGVTGVSYGGYIASWLVTQDPRFAAAVAVSPATNLVSLQLTSNIPYFLSLVLDGNYNSPDSKYLKRSPIMHASAADTPTLLICGAQDRCTPPAEALQFHRALLDCGTPSTLITYPEEGHGIRSFPALIDYSVRVVLWFEEYLGKELPSRSTSEPGANTRAVGKAAAR